MLNERSANDVTVSSESIKRLLSSGDGKACLYYLAEISSGAHTPETIAKLLGWSLSEAESARTKLEALSLIKPESDMPPADDTIPVYSSSEISDVMSGDEVFQSLVSFTKIKLNKVLTSNDLSKLLGIYDHLGLSANIIMLLISFCASREKRANGEAAKLRMWQIEREAFYWRRNGIMTETAAESYIRNTEKSNLRADEILQILQIRGRSPSATEEKYLKKWAGFDMEDELIYSAYDKTVVNTGGLKWGYMDKILSDWHQKGIRSAGELNKQSPKEYISANGGSKQKQQYNQRTSLSGGGANAAERLKRHRAALGENQ
jgi:DnaD/phage-associated family protein